MRPARPHPEFPNGCAGNSRRGPPSSTLRTMRSSIDPVGTRFSTSATVTAAAVAIIGLKFRAVLR